jgi:hypothetical protein
MNGPRLMGNPFDLGNDAAYRQWRGNKLVRKPAGPAALLVVVESPEALTPAELDAIITRCRDYNMAIYTTPRPLGKPGTLAFARQLGLTRFDSPLWTGSDGVTAIQAAGEGRQAAYIPYSNRPLSWHTDGYYNDSGHQVRGVVLHCERNAASGGVTALMDPDIAYIRLRDENPDHIAALSRADVLTIPANYEADALIRPAQTGPVFSTIDDRLHMRYSARKRYVEWRDDGATWAARQALDLLLEGDNDDIIRHRLQPGEGLISNNVLHNRSGFEDHPETGRDRLLYRARFLDRVSA